MCAGGSLSRSAGSAESWGNLARPNATSRVSARTSRAGWLGSSSWRVKAKRVERIWRQEGPLRMLALVDEYTRECLAIDVERRLDSENVLERLETPGRTATSSRSTASFATNCSIARSSTRSVKQTSWSNAGARSTTRSGRIVRSGTGLRHRRRSCGRHRTRPVFSPRPRSG